MSALTSASQGRTVIPNAGLLRPSPLRSRRWAGGFASSLGPISGGFGGRTTAGCGFSDVTPCIDPGAMRVRDHAAAG